MTLIFIISFHFVSQTQYLKDYKTLSSKLKTLNFFVILRILSKLLTFEKTQIIFGFLLIYS